jgi:hypothetical protein
VPRQEGSKPVRRSRNTFRVIQPTDGETDEVFQGQLGAGWLYEQRLTRQDGTWVVAELQVFLYSPREHASIWGKHEVVTSEATKRLPRGGLTARLIRSIPFGRGPHSALTEIDVAFRDYVKSRQQRIAAESRQQRTRGKLLETANSTSASLKRDFELAETARLYVEWGRKGSRRPNVEVASVLNVKPSQVRDAIHRARLRGLLTSDDQKKQGAAKGELTEKARALLADPEQVINGRNIAAKAIRASRNYRRRLKMRD